MNATAISKKALIKELCFYKNGKVSNAELKKILEENLQDYFFAAKIDKRFEKGLNTIFLIKRIANGVIFKKIKYAHGFAARADNVNLITEFFVNI